MGLLQDIVTQAVKSVDHALKPAASLNQKINIVFFCNIWTIGYFKFLFPNSNLLNLHNTKYRINYLLRLTFKFIKVNIQIEEKQKSNDHCKSWMIK